MAKFHPEKGNNKNSLVKLYSVVGGKKQALLSSSFLGPTKFRPGTIGVGGTDGVLRVYDAKTDELKQQMYIRNHLNKVDLVPGMTAFRTDQAAFSAKPKKKAVATARAPVKKIDADDILNQCPAGPAKPQPKVPVPAQKMAAPKLLPAKQAAQKLTLSQIAARKAQIAARQTAMQKSATTVSSKANPHMNFMAMCTSSAQKVNRAAETTKVRQLSGNQQEVKVDADEVDELENKIGLKRKALPTGSAVAPKWAEQPVSVPKLSKKSSGKSSGKSSAKQVPGPSDGINPKTSSQKDLFSFEQDQKVESYIAYKKEQEKTKINWAEEAPEKQVHLSDFYIFNNSKEQRFAANFMREEELLRTNWGESNTALGSFGEREIDDIAWHRG